MTVSRQILKARGITKTFEGDQILEDVDLDVTEGETVLLMGPNGAGKTILMCCLAGGLYPTEGDITVLGDGVSAAADSLTLQLQRSLALPSLTARENLEFYDDLHPSSTGEGEAIIEKLDVDADLDGKILKDFSGGMVEKIELAITLATNVPLYFLDEPTASLDLSAITALHDQIISMQREDKTFLITSHTPLDIQIADRIVFITDGSVVIRGRPEALLETMPDVVRIRGPIHEVLNEARSHLLSEQAFRRGDEARGFLSADATVDRVRSAVTERAEDCTVDLDTPSYTDMFNYYSHVYSDANARPIDASSTGSADSEESPRPLAEPLERS